MMVHTRLRKKVCWVVSCEFAVTSFLLDHIASLHPHCDFTLVLNTDNPRFLEAYGLHIRVIPVGIERQISIWRDIKAQLKLTWIFFRERFDVVHSITPKAGLLAMVASWIARVPNRIHTFQGEVWITRRGFWRVFLKAMDKLVARLATRLLVVSPSELRFLEQEKIIPPRKAEVLAKGSICGVNGARFRPNANARETIRKEFGIAPSAMLFLYVGRLIIDKGVLDLATAFARVCAEEGDAHLMLVGPEEQEMQERIRSIVGSKSENRIHFVGYTRIPEQYMAAADALCLPSYREGFGMVIIEAGAVGIPVLASRIYGITDALEDRVTGMLHEPRDADGLHCLMRQLIDNPEMRVTMGADARKRVERDFSMEIVTAAVVEYYKKMLS